MFIACLTVGCSEEGVGEKSDDAPSLLANYTVLLQKDGVLKTAFLKADPNGIDVDPDNGDFEKMPQPKLYYKNGDKMGFYKPEEDCSAHITVHEYIIRKITSHELNKPAFRQAGEKTLLR